MMAPLRTMPRSVPKSAGVVKGSGERPSFWFAGSHWQTPDHQAKDVWDSARAFPSPPLPSSRPRRSEEHTSELQSLMRISYAVFCLKKKKRNNKKTVCNAEIHNTSI